MHVVRALGRLGQEPAEVGVLDLAEQALVAEHRRECPRGAQRLGLGVGGDVHDAAAPTVRLGAAEALHVDVLAGDGTDDVGAGDEDSAGGTHDDDVGERRAVGGATRGGTEHDRDLWDAAGRPGHDGEHLADRVQGQDPLAQPRAAGVPEPDHRAVVCEGAGVRGQDDLAACGAHGAALDRRVGRERDGRRALDTTDAGEHAAVVLGGDDRERPGVEQRRHAHLGVARVDHDRFSGESGGRVGRGHQAVRKTRATLWPPKPNELLSAAIGPSGSLRGVPLTMSRATSSSGSSRLIVGGASR